MASSRGTLNGPDVRDVTAVMLAFEHINNCILELRMGIAHDAKEVTMSFELTAWGPGKESGEAERLASSKLLPGYKDHRTVEVLITQLMYALDAQMAEEEFAAASNQKA